MRLTDLERDPVLRGLFEIAIAYAAGDEKREQCEALAAKFGGDADAMFFEAVRGKSAERPQLANASQRDPTAQAQVSGHLRASPQAATSVDVP